jgi:hypothetical protein
MLALGGTGEKPQSLTRIFFIALEARRAGIRSLHSLSGRQRVRRHCRLADLASLRRPVSRSYCTISVTAAVCDSAELPLPEVAVTVTV